MSTFAADMDEAMRLTAEIKVLAAESAAINRVEYETGPIDAMLAALARTQDIGLAMQEKQTRQTVADRTRACRVRHTFKSTAPTMSSASSSTAGSIPFSYTGNPRFDPNPRALVYPCPPEEAAALKAHVDAGGLHRPVALPDPRSPMPARLLQPTPSPPPPAMQRAQSEPAQTSASVTPATPA